MRIAVLSLLISAVAVSAVAQSPTPGSAAPRRPRDPIAALLNPSGPQAGDEEEPDTAGQPRAVGESDFDLNGPIPVPNGPPIPFAPPPRTKRDLPVSVEQTGLTPDLPPDLRAQTYDARVRASFAAAQGFLGPLDGGWTLSIRGRDYGLQIVDRRDRLEAVWRDLGRPGALDASGLVETIERAGGVLTLRFTEPQEPTALVTLSATPDGRWTGEMKRGDARFAVTMRHTSP